MPTYILTKRLGNTKIRMPHRAWKAACVSLLCMICLPIAGVAASPIGLTLQTREGESGRVLATKESVDASKIGVVIIDMWNSNDCMTNAQRAAALVPRMNKALEGFFVARARGRRRGSGS